MPKTRSAGPGRTTLADPAFRQRLFVSFGAQYGLSWVNAILEDSLGRLWFTTGSEGLICYDGAYFTVFKESDGLASDHTSCVLEDRQGHLWIGTGNWSGGRAAGLCRYDGNEFTTFTREDGLVSDGVFSLLDDRRGRIWIGGEDGVSCYDGKRFQTYTVTDGLVEGRISSISEDRHGHLWFGVGNYYLPGRGLCRYDGSSFRRFTAADGLADDRVATSFVNREGTLFIGTRTGAYRYDSEHFIPLEQLASLTICAIAQDGRGHMWFSANPHGVRRFDGTEWTSFTTVDGLVSDQVLSLYIDRQNNLWFGALTGLSRRDQGVFDHFTQADGLPHNTVLSLAEDRRGHLWIGTMQGASRWDGARFEILEDLANWMVWSIIEDGQGCIWCSNSNGTEASGGMGYYDGTDFRSFKASEGLADNDTWCLLEDSQGHIWAGSRSQGGVSRYDGSDFQIFTTEDGLVGNRVCALLEDRQGHIWFATNTGVGRYDGSRFSIFTAADGVPESAVMCLVEDSRGRIWVGTFGGGISYYDGEKFHTLSTRDGLVFDLVNALLEDSRGHLWVGTYGGGISRYDGLVFQTLSRQDGLLHDAIQAFYEDRHGHIWIATEGGLVRYRPSSTPPKVRLKALVADRRYGPEEAVGITGRQKTISFEFEGISLSTPLNRMAYVCRLRGIETEWKPVYEGRIEYQDLPEGDYTFQVKAVDRDLNYSAPAQVRITVEPDALIESLAAALGQSGGAGEFVGRSQALRDVQGRLAQVAPTDLTVLILGDTGTGKGLAARTLHRLSPRGDKPFVLVTVGALPESLIESELFGHEKGAFTGATSRRLGKVEIAQGGTLFLDEIGDMPQQAQLKLLRLLEERTFERLGSEKTQEAQVRIVAATNRDLPAQIKAGAFRQDLYFRLCGFEVHLPPLRQRLDDIPLLALYFIEAKAAHLDKPVPLLSPAAENALVAHPWPGNVRELEHTIGRAVVVCRDKEIRVEDLGLADQAGAAVVDEESVTLAEWERRYIVRILEQKQWVVSGPQGAAALLGLNEGTLRSRMKKLGIKRPQA